MGSPAHQTHNPTSSPPAKAAEGCRNPRPSGPHPLLITPHPSPKRPFDVQFSPFLGSNGRPSMSPAQAHEAGSNRILLGRAPNHFSQINRMQFKSSSLQAILLLLATGVVTPTPNRMEAAESASRVVEDGGTGPYPALMATDSTLPTHTIFRPKDLSLFGGQNRLPIIVWGNGACANSPWEHVNFLSEVASHGFLVIAIGPMPAEGQRGAAGGPTSSALMLEAIQWAINQDQDEKSPFHSKLNASKIAACGMSCGGLQALETCADPRVATAVICNSGILGNPGSGFRGMPNLTKGHLSKLHTPVLYILGGEKDIAYNNGMDDVRRLNHVPVFAANLNVGHGGTYSRPHGGDFAKVATAWLKWQLKGDKGSAGMFEGEACGVSKMEGWKIEKKNIP